MAPRARIAQRVRTRVLGAPAPDPVYIRSGLPDRGPSPLLVTLAYIGCGDFIHTSHTRPPHAEILHAELSDTHDRETERCVSDCVRRGVSETRNTCLF